MRSIIVYFSISLRILFSTSAWEHEILGFEFQKRVLSFLSSAPVWWTFELRCTPVFLCNCACVIKKKMFSFSFATVSSGAFYSHRTMPAEELFVESIDHLLSTAKAALESKHHVFVFFSGSTDLKTGDSWSIDCQKGMLDDSFYAFFVHLSTILGQHYSTSSLVHANKRMSIFRLVLRQFTNSIYWTIGMWTAHCSSSLYTDRHACWWFRRVFLFIHILLLLTLSKRDYWR